MRNGLLLLLGLALTASVWFVLAAAPESGPAAPEPAGSAAAAPRPGAAVPVEAGLGGEELATTRTAEAVLGPEADALHRDHFHLDLSGRSSAAICE